MPAATVSPIEADIGHDVAREAAEQRIQSELAERADRASRPGDPDIERIDARHHAIDGDERVLRLPQQPYGGGEKAHRVSPCRLHLACMRGANEKSSPAPAVSGSEILPAAP